MFKGLVIDQLKTLDTRKTKSYSTYFDAHTAAEQLCRRTMGDRGQVEVEEIDADISKAASAFAKLGGSCKSDAKTKSSRENGKLGGRPKKERAK